MHLKARLPVQQCVSVHGWKGSEHRGAGAFEEWTRDGGGDGAFQPGHSQSALGVQPSCGTTRHCAKCLSGFLKHAWLLSVQQCES